MRIPVTGGAVLFTHLMQADFSTQDTEAYYKAQDAATLINMDMPIPVRLEPLLLNRKMSGFMSYGLLHVQHTVLRPTLIPWIHLYLAG